MEGWYKSITKAKKFVTVCYISPHYKKNFPKKSMKEYHRFLYYSYRDGWPFDDPRDLFYHDMVGEIPEHYKRYLDADTESDYELLIPKEFSHGSRTVS